MKRQPIIGGVGLYCPQCGKKMTARLGADSDVHQLLACAKEHWYEWSLAPDSSEEVMTTYPGTNLTEALELYKENFA